MTLQRPKRLNFQYIYKSFLLTLVFLLQKSSSTEVFLADSFFRLEYTFSDSYHIEITMTCTSQGWVGLGIGESMLDADIVIGHYSVEKNPVLLDYSSISFGPPQQDIIQDVTLTGHKRNKQGTSFAFKRRIKPNDMNDKEIKLNEPMKLIWACGESDRLDYHKMLRGVFTVTFESRHLGPVTTVCHWTCKTCSGPSSEQCKSCYDNKVKK